MTAEPVDAPGIDPASVEPAAQILLSGRYRLGDELGAGPAGHTYRGYDVLLHRDVAVKVLDGLPDDDAVARAIRAARMAARAGHPRLVEVLDVERGRPAFVVLALASGVPLSALLSAGQPTPRLALSIADDVLAALAALHAAGAVHRGVGLDNVWLAADGRALLTAAGLAAAARDPGLGRGIGGGQARVADARTDVADAAEMVRTLLGDTADDRLAEVLERATAPRPEGRYYGAEQLRDALRQAGAPAAAAAPAQDPRPGKAGAPPASGAPAEAPAAPRVAAPRPPRAAPAPPIEEPARAPQPAPVAERGWTAPVRGRSRVLARLLLGSCVAGAAWLVVGVPLMAGSQAEEPPRASAAPPPVAQDPLAPQEPVLAPPAALPADGLRRVLDTAAQSPANLGRRTRELLERLEGLDRMRGGQRAAEAAELYGLAAVDAASTNNSAALSGQVAELLRPELSVDGLVGLIDRDPGAVGSGAQTFGTRLRLLDSLSGEQRSAEAYELWLASQDGVVAGTLTPEFAAVAQTVLQDLRSAG